MGKYKVIRIDGENDNPVSPLKIQAKMNEMDKAGWRFVQLSSSGGPGEGHYMPNWVYLVFASESKNQ